jgi:integrase
MGLPERVDNVVDLNKRRKNKNIKPVEQLKKCTKVAKSGEIKKTPCNAVKGDPHEVYPIKDKKDIEKMRNYFQKQIDKAEYESDRKIAYRNLLMFVMSINLGLRFSDILSLKWGEIFDSKGNFFDGIRRSEKKTGKFKTFFLNQSCKDAITNYITQVNPTIKDDLYIFKSREGGSIEVRTAGKILKEAAEACEFNFNFGTHSCRKTFGYWFYVTHNEDIRALTHLQRLFAHSSTAVTLRYIGIEDEETKQFYDDLNL